MAQMTEKRYRKLKAELVSVKERHAQAMLEQEEAKEFGDLRENSEYETARSKAEQLASRKEQLEEEIMNAKIVEEDRSPRITIGSVVDVCKVDRDGNQLGETRRFTVDSHGDTVLQKILGAESSLGKIIMNGTSGKYQVPDNGGTWYQVTKVVGVDA